MTDERAITMNQITIHKPQKNFLRPVRTGICFTLLACMLLSCGCTSGSYVTVGSYSSSTKNSYFLEYHRFDGTKQTSLQLEEGDILNVELVCEEGTLGVTLQKEDDTPIYAEENCATDSFSLEITEAGTYTLTLQADNTKGSVNFYVAE